MAHQATTPIERVLKPFQAFLQREASGGIVLLAATLISFAVVNSPGGQSFQAFWDQPLGVTFRDWSMSESLRNWVNDGLMAIFFFVIGLEIKRETLVGELATVRQTILPLVAAVGGMVVPSLIYLALNPSYPNRAGWGIPMATDIAFSLGILALLGSRVPVGLKVFLTALAIVDDIGAVLVIAIFYGKGLHHDSLLWAAGIYGFMWCANALGVRRMAFYGLSSVLLWYFVHHSGIHATVAGVLAAMTVPAQSRMNAPQFSGATRSLLDEFDQAADNDSETMLSDEQISVVERIERRVERVNTPLQMAIHVMHPWAAYVIMPIFALANAGVALNAPIEVGSVGLGIFFGLALGKPLGIAGFSLLATRFGIATLPTGVTPRHIVGAGVLAGVGFTMSLFIATLAFPSAALLEQSKIAILGASLAAGVAGYAILARLSNNSMEASA